MLNRTFAQKRRDENLEQRIRRDLVFLFDAYGATVNSNTVEAFGHSQITVAVGNLEFQFAKNDRDGEARVMVGPRNGHGVWELLRVALAASTGEDVAELGFPISFIDDPASLHYIGLASLAACLKPRFDRLNDAFAPQNYPDTHARMAHIERIVHPR
jgi:hypothetical protein